MVMLVFARTFSKQNTLFGELLHKVSKLKKSKEMIHMKVRLGVQWRKVLVTFYGFCVDDGNMLVSQHMKLYTFWQACTFPKLKVLQLIS